MLLTLLLLNHDCPLEVKIIFLLKHIEEWRVRASINANLLELVPEVVLDRLLLEAVSFHDDIVLTFEDKAIDNEVLFLEEVRFLEKAYNLLCIYIVVTLFNIHCHGVELRASGLLPLLLEFVILLHNVIVIEDSKAKLVFEHLCLQVFEHHVSHTQFLVCRHVFGMRQLPVEGHDGPESVPFGN